MIRTPFAILLILTNISAVGQSKIFKKDILGSWKSEDDFQSKLIVKRKIIYQVYDKDTLDRYCYYFDSKSKFAKSKGSFLKLVRINKISDTLNFEILGLTKDNLSLLDLSNTGKIWILKR